MKFGLVHARYIFVGLITNVSVLAVYYSLTLFVGVGPKSALFFATLLGLVLNYLANSTWTFNSSTKRYHSSLRYLVGYVASYSLQWLILYVGTDLLGFAHQWVVLVGLVIASISFFQIQRYWVFASDAKPR
ncbi:Putative flippase GtrA (transmembrane translocase of bactoprenol-linked glucose) [Roseovarius litoreus]|uniref:Flippase GtrA (Transmembrane translocase of bactoprenol-linked glucose) n=1 Tax=Roseovarius litoreus TaxID=1155722 RepID=A0A1M7A014_9RHOB|nr:GtrA family protein [Roseovarius litoreus]SHL35949.1 Putative flippase GtrA (transmembrane translocase of bactoprenol-linked glucose) [Roseovarius litoreus]